MRRAMMPKTAVLVLAACGAVAGCGGSAKPRPRERTYDLTSGRAPLRIASPRPKARLAGRPIDAVHVATKTTVSGRGEPDEAVYLSTTRCRVQGCARMAVADKRGYWRARLVVVGGRLNPWAEIAA